MANAWLVMSLTTHSHIHTKQSWNQFQSKYWTVTQANRLEVILYVSIVIIIMELKGAKISNKPTPTVLLTEYMLSLAHGQSWNWKHPNGTFVKTHRSRGDGDHLMDSIARTQQQPVVRLCKFSYFIYNDNNICAYFLYHTLFANVIRH